MGKDSGISWTHHTFNIVWGCTKVSEACKNCYAESWSKKTGRDLWGADKPRMVLSNDYWRQPLKWDKAAAAAGERHRVFCSSMADVFEDHPTVEGQRARLWPLIEATPNLDWLLLTKRPENIHRHGPWSSWPENVWLGTTTENQERFDERWPHLANAQAVVRFVSAEPLLGSIILPPDAKTKLHWCIIGGESGSDEKRRTMDIGAATYLADRCAVAGIKVFTKQDSARKSGERGRLSDWMWGLKEFPQAVGISDP